MMGWPSTFTPGELIEWDRYLGSVGEDQVVPIWGFEDLKPMARTMLDILNEHRPGEWTALKGELQRFIEEGS